MVYQISSTYEIIIYIALLAGSILLHEYAHLFALNRVSPKAHRIKLYWMKDWSINVGTSQDYEGLTTNQYSAVALSGIVGGLLPLILFACIESFSVEGIILIGLYLVGCRHDIMILQKNYKQNAPKKETTKIEPVKP